MGEDYRSIRLKRLHSQLGEVAYEMTSIHFSKYCSPEAWQPAINAYRCRDCFRVCVDLAGVKKSEIRVRVEPGRLIVSGRREPPEPVEHPGQIEKVLAMEIDCGPFERTISLPDEVDRERVTAEQNNGLLWIFLPIRHQG